MVKKSTSVKYYEAVGRRKSATARVRFYIASASKEVVIDSIKIKPGDIVINNVPVTQYFPQVVHARHYLRPLELANAVDRFAISIRVAGGGRQGQLGAVVLGMSRALQIIDKENRALLKTEGLLTRDARVKERRKVGTGGKARRKKQSPKR